MKSTPPPVSWGRCRSPVVWGGGSVSGTKSLANSGYIFGARITSVSITGSVIAGSNTGSGTLTNSGAIRAAYYIGPITVGSLMGNKTNPVVISARGQQSPGHRLGHRLDHCRDLEVLPSVVSVSFTNILAGYDTGGNGINAAAQIGAVTVNGSWTASNLVAGAGLGADGQFGTADDAKLATSDALSLVSQIGPIVITGTVSGNASNTSAYYGFVARQVTSLKIGVTVITLKTGQDNDKVVQVGNSGTVKGTVTVNEVLVLP